VIADKEREMEEVRREGNKEIDQKLYYESVIDKKEESMVKLHDEIMRLREEIRTKDDEVREMSTKIIEKGEKNQKLTEKLAEMKNHYMTTHYLN
jgi:peptidoglycan hydrolase CwlO-like protein